ncbi:hypothetical protein GFF61_15700 [Salmonella enterica]|nr:hypothetical protein [Salmonella enterica]
MTRFLLSLGSALMAFSYYLILWIDPTVLSHRASILGVLIAFFGLHIGLKRILNRHVMHVFCLFVTAGLFTFYRSFTDGNVFLYVLIGLHGVVVLTVLLTIPLSSERSEPK